MYKKEDLDRINDYCRKNNIDTVISTEKDAVKLQRVEGIKQRTESREQRVEYLVLKVRLEIIENEDGFFNRLFGIYSS